MNTSADILKQCQADPADIIKYFGNQIKKTRKIRQLSQEQLAELAGLDRVTISRYERGEGSQLNLISAFAIALALGVSLSSLLPTPELTPAQMLENLKTIFDISAEEILRELRKS